MNSRNSSGFSSRCPPVNSNVLFSSRNSPVPGRNPHDAPDTDHHLSASRAFAEPIINQQRGERDQSPHDQLIIVYRHSVPPCASKVARIAPGRSSGFCAAAESPFPTFHRCRQPCAQDLARVRVSNREGDHAGPPFSARVRISNWPTRQGENYPICGLRKCCASVEFSGLRATSNHPKSQKIIQRSYEHVEGS
jgi:hypothetical protein